MHITALLLLSCLASMAGMPSGTRAAGVSAAV
jgi:hypothetical protein